MEEVGKILPALFRKQLKREDSRIMDILAPLWPRVAGKGIAENSTPAAFVEGTLTLETSCASWAVQLRQIREEIRAGINQSLGCSAVKEIKVQLAPGLGLRDPEIPRLLHLSPGFKKADAARSNPSRTAPKRRVIEQ